MKAQRYESVACQLSIGRRDGRNQRISFTGESERWHQRRKAQHQAISGGEAGVVAWKVAMKEKYLWHLLAREISISNGAIATAGAAL